MDNNPNIENKTDPEKVTDNAAISEKTQSGSESAPIIPEPAAAEDYGSDDFDPSELDLKEDNTPGKNTAAHARIPAPTAAPAPAYAPQEAAAEIPPGKTTAHASVKARKLPRSFNNGEPVSVAVRSMCRQLLAVLLVVAAIFLAATAKYIIIGRVSDDGIFSLTMNSKYKETVEVEGVKNFTPKKSSGYAAAEAVSVLTNNKITESKLLEENDGKDSSFLNSGMQQTLEKAFPGSNVVIRTNLSNFTLLTEIYDNIADGNGVIVSLSLPRKEFVTDAEEITYAVVTSVNYSTDQITVVTSYGDTRIMSAEDFIKATRYSKIAKKSPKLNIEFLTGLKTINTVYFIENKDTAK